MWPLSANLIYIVRRLFDIFCYAGCGTGDISFALSKPSHKWLLESLKANMVPEKETTSGPCANVGGLNPSDTDDDRSVMKFE